MTLRRMIISGARAGAAGATARSAVTYLDLAIRARQANDTPERAVDVFAARSGHPVPGDDVQKQNRLAALGPLTGLAAGVAVGMIAGPWRPVLRWIPTPIAVAALGAAAMALVDGPMVKLGLTDPYKWSREEWLSDIVPNLAYGAVAYGALRGREG